MNISISRIFFTLCLFMVLLTSCNNQKTKIKIESNLDKIDDIFSIDRSEKDNYYGAYTKEITYSPPSYDSFNGIYPINSLENGRFYCILKKRFETKTNLSSIQMLSYVNLDNGKTYYACQDPLCSHTPDSQCNYLGFFQYESLNNSIFATRQNITTTDTDTTAQWCIYKISSEQNFPEIIYQCEDMSSFILLIGTEENILYFFVVHNEEDLENKITITSYTLMSYNCVSKQVSSYSQLPSDMVDRNSEALFIYDGYIYFASIDGLCKTDINFIHKETIYTYAENEWYGAYYYDSHTDEFIFNIQNDEMNYGCIYTYSSGVLTKLLLPHENIYYFQVTNEKIYYSPYNPKYYGTSPRGGEVYDYTGGKIFEVNRTNLSDSTLIFQCDDDFALKGDYIVIGNYIYFTYWEIMREGGSVWFSTALDLKLARINYIDNTLHYIVFD